MIELNRVWDGDGYQNNFPNNVQTNGNIELRDRLSAGGEVEAWMYNAWKWGIGSVASVKRDGWAGNDKYSNGVPSTAADLGYQLPLRLSKNKERTGAPSKEGAP